MSVVSINYKFSDSGFVAVFLNDRYGLALTGSAEMSEDDSGGWQVSAEILETDGLTTRQSLRFAGEREARYVAERINGKLPN